MNIILTCRHVDAPPELREYVETKTGKLAKFYDRIQEVEVIFDHESEEQFSVGIVVRADQRQTFVASESGPDTYVLVDRVIERLERQLKRHKEKTRDHKHTKRADVMEES